MTGCGLAGQLDADQASSEALTCLHAIKSSPDGRAVYARLWASNETDNADKLADQKPLTRDEREALVRVHNKVQPCRRIIIAHDNKFAAWETPYWQDLFRRQDVIFTRLASGEMAVGVANKLTIESLGTFQADVSRGHADAVQLDDIRRQRTAEALINASAQMAASQPRPRMMTTNCFWSGNNLNCTSLGR
jgi:hypothetical protein